MWSTVNADQHEKERVVGREVFRAAAEQAEAEIEANAHEHGNPEHTHRAQSLLDVWLRVRLLSL